MATDINAITLTCRLTRDPDEPRVLASGNEAVKMRVAYTTAKRVNGEYVDQPNYIDVNVYGGLARICAQQLKKGRQIAVTGRLIHETWTTQAGEPRDTHTITANDVKFLHNPNANGAGDQEPTPQPTGDENIPF